MISEEKPALLAPPPPVEAEKELSPPVSPAPRGNRLAIASLVLATAALGFSLYGLSIERGDTLPPLPAVPPDMAGVSNLEARVQKQEARQGQLAEDLARVTAHFETAAKNPDAPAAAPADDIKGSVEDLKQKIGSVEKGGEALQAELRATLMRKTQLLSDWALLQGVRMKLRDGAGFAAERKALAAEAPQDQLQTLDAIANPATVSDLSLREDLRALSPHFASLEKMAAAKGFFQQLAARAENLVTIRPKDGLPASDTPSGKNLAALHEALNAHAWASAMARANLLAQKAPPEFAAWQARLQQRSAAEAALDAMEAAFLAALRDDAAKSAAPAAETATPSAPPVSAPVAGEASP